MKQLPVFFFTVLMCIVIGCQKSASIKSSKEEAFFTSQQDAVNRVNAYNEQSGTKIKIDSVTNISYIYTQLKSYAFIFYETPSGTQNLVVSRNYEKDGSMKSEEVSTCGGNECTCKVQAVIDNQGNVTIGCNCASCVMITAP